MIYAVIPTGSRPTEYKSVYEWCKNHGIEPLTIATSPAAADYAEGQTFHHSDLNISQWWNLGINYAHAHKAEHIFVFNDDVVLPDDWAAVAVEALESGYVGASGVRGDGKITGYAFALNGQQRIKADESLVWWYGDDDIQRQCEQAGGFIAMPELNANNLYGDSEYYRFKTQIDKDREYYSHKWGIQL